VLTDIGANQVPRDAAPAAPPPRAYEEEEERPYLKKLMRVLHVFLIANKAPPPPEGEGEGPPCVSNRK